MAAVLARPFATMLRFDLASPSFTLSAFLVFAALLVTRDPYGAGDAVDAFVYPFQWGNALELATIAAGICSAANLARDINTGSCLAQVSRIGRDAYFRSRYAADSVATGLAFSTGFAAYLIFALLTSGQVVPERLGEPGIYFGSFDYLIEQGLVVAWFAVVLVVQFFFGMLVGGLGVAATLLTRNVFICTVAPFLALFYWRQIATVFGAPEWANPLRLARCMAFVPVEQWAPVCYAASFATFTAAVGIAFAIAAQRKGRAL